MTSSRARFFTDGCRADSLPSGLLPSFRKHNLISVPGTGQGEGTVSFCGLVVTEESLNIFLPKTCSPEDSQASRQMARLMFGALFRYINTPDNRKRLEEHEASPFHCEEKEALSGLSVYMRLLEDWQAHGPWREILTRKQRSVAGRINWPRTMAAVSPLLQQDRPPLYPVFVTTRPEVRDATLIAQLQAWCVRQADRLIGWLLSRHHTGLVAPELAHLPEPLPCPRKYAVYMLRRALSGQYNARNIRLLKLLLAILDDTGTRHPEPVRVFGVREFWRVWEEICKSVLEDRYGDYIGLIPQPRYLVQGGKPAATTGARQIPDIILTEGNCLAVADAKYYDIRKTLPGWPDIVKQIYYAKSLAVTCGFPVTANCFLFPDPHVAAEERPEQVVMYLPGSTAALAANEFMPVRCVYLNLADAMAAFIQGKKLATMRQIIFSGSPQPAVDGVT